MSKAYLKDSNEPEASTSSEKSDSKESKGGASAEAKAAIADFLLHSADSEDKQITVPDFLNAKWDPDDIGDGEFNNPPSPACIRRIKNDITALYSDPPPGLCVIPDPMNITKIHALLTGPFDTPYEGGFFYFFIRFPSDYPISPPRVRLMTTGGGTVRFNPNLYRNGKVCLSILGTWAGPSWSPAQTLSSVLISIQSLMNEKPYHNEPGFEHERTSGDSKHYNDIIQHETVRVAVCDMMDGLCSMPDSLRAVMESSFPDYYKYYVEVCENHIHLDSMDMNDPFGDSRPKFKFKQLLKRLKCIQNRMDNKPEDSDEDEDDNSAQEGEETTPPRRTQPPIEEDKS
ncbi:ubiquitin-conjugating enzyme E2 Z [Aplysia californica]|uniref:Ubiquitin-conjugating enzyme E2 Z n=1 Tax=Aplysia californica TaxID=6500 RepID=A0ABM0ZVQ2_APLCA|nr:ubiquitin-conjugating enzyme E2 Z [Aplysia californica]XP_005094048.1 ubiquitin-conjugating enzyme E2 Z [Aplysia californica]XP_012935523.1 ubiquitin-conjugating enzyme E2 Z [Aplysia californica]